ncbi:19868_t:CDS:2 [Funneliformis geosporum]|uniref:3619_t:CDS:1 n=1 Tax=Funneliformis geosporum TaxID=1117311 RepID=A0A9W4SJW8_9GLOM|nr:3619_t:CDS:2 [Funneliformis geosporum]CAI2178342.1 19868_t:CDS:2 [Funneliformis geosporum]
MHFNNLITRRRKTEPKSVHVLRACIKTFLLAFLVAYIIFMINEVIHDVPVIHISEEDADEMPFPDNTINIEIPMLGLINKLLNSYVIINNQYSYIELARHKRKKIRRGIRDILFGFPSYDVQPFIVSNLLSMPLTDEQRTRPDAYLSKIGLNIKNFQIQVETERRTRSLLNVVGLVGGAWSISMVLYTLLFGANLFRPWGCTQAYCCGYRTYNKFKNTLPVLPLVNSSSLLTKPNPSLQDITELQDRLNSLEMFLMEYVVDVKYLEKSEKMDQKLDDGK